MNPFGEWRREFSAELRFRDNPGLWVLDRLDSLGHRFDHWWIRTVNNTLDRFLTGRWWFWSLYWKLTEVVSWPFWALICSRFDRHYSAWLRDKGYVERVLEEDLDA